ncbi:cell wall protein RBR3 [Arachis duranensis]|uniref:Cell wall protein RBR3 n=1 Tax=Arachis duranensis TaxID=130453 RepID=A0A6P4CZ48_ARADU|nr:cell wall protein RBR3 [Arachis duranensis]
MIHHMEEEEAPNNPKTVKLVPDCGIMQQCPHHHNHAGGICAFCLQDKLGKLLSSSFPAPIQPSSPPSSSSPSPSSPPPPPSFRSNNTPPPSSSSSLPTKKTDHYTRSRLPFLLANKTCAKKKQHSSSSSTSAPADVVLKRSKSTATPRRDTKFFNNHDILIQDFTPRKRNGFWSFLYLSSSSSSSSSKKLHANNNGATPRVSASISSASGLTITKPTTTTVAGGLQESSDGYVSVCSSFERKVSRSRSVGCGSSRSFSGDFFDRISNGFGDCTLRRVESQREGNHNKHHHHNQQCMKERVKCGGIFGGFMMMPNTSSFS